MDPGIWIAHVLALHLNVPEPIRFTIDELWPYPYIAMTEMRDGEWRVQYDRTGWSEDSDSKKQFVIAHELCHSIFDRGVDWSTLAPKEQRRRHDYVNACAKQILRDHRNCLKQERRTSR